MPIERRYQTFRRVERPLYADGAAYGADDDDHQYDDGQQEQRDQQGEEVDPGAAAHCVEGDSERGDRFGGLVDDEVHARDDGFDLDVADTDRGGVFAVVDDVDVAEQIDHPGVSLLEFFGDPGPHLHSVGGSAAEVAQEAVDKACGDDQEEGDVEEHAAA